MTRYISQKKAHDDRAKLNLFRRKLKIALEALDTIAANAPCETEGCACCTPITGFESPTEHCDVGNAKVAIFLIKEVGNG